MLAAALGNSSEHFSTAKGKNTPPPPSFEVRTALQLVPTEALGPVTAKPACPVPSFGHWKNECPKARKEEEAPAVVGLADLEIN